jgi:hypothetical protein
MTPSPYPVTTLINHYSTLTLTLTTTLTLAPTLSLALT